MTDINELITRFINAKKTTAFGGSISTVQKILHENTKSSKTQFKNAVRELDSVCKNTLSTSDMYSVANELRSWMRSYLERWDEIPKKIPFRKYQEWLANK